MIPFFFRELLSKIQSIASSKSEPGKEQQAVYELFVSPEKTDSLNMSKMMELNQRLNKLETLLGADPDALVTVFKVYFHVLLIMTVN